LELTTADVVVGELRNHATRRSGSRAFRTSLEARSEGKKQPSYILIFKFLHSNIHPLLHRNFVTVETKQAIEAGNCATGATR
jgi:hypothetical protein